MDASTKGFINYAEDFKSRDSRTAMSSHGDNHKKLIAHVYDKLKCSEEAMCRFYPRWRANELRLLAFAESQLAKDKHKNLCENKHRKNKKTDIAVPYIFSTMQTICTYMIQTFAGRKPMLQLGAYDPENLKRARLMEKKLQYDADHTKLINKFWGWFWDAQLYGVGALHVDWKIERAQRRVAGNAESPGRTQQTQIVFEGNESTLIDPFLFYPDPSVPMSNASTDGEFMAWRSFKRMNYIIKQGLLGNLAHTDSFKKETWTNYNEENNHLSFRDRVSGYTTGSVTERPKDIVQVDTGVYEIIPEEYGLKPKGDADFNPKMPAKWLIILLNKDTIAYAAPYDHDHNRMPVCVIEPYGDGHSFGSVGVPDLLADMQDTATFLLDSHIKSVRQVINQKILVDPSAVNISDLNNDKAGAIVRLKKGSLGTDVNTVLQDFTPQDPTQRNISSLASIMQIGDMISGTNDNLRGQQTSNSRKTATEVRSSNESSSNRLAAQSMRISSQGISSFKEISALNNMQFLSDDFSITLHGEEMFNDAENPNPVSPQSLLGPEVQPDTSQEITANSIIGDFYYPIHDGTLPMDKVAIAQLWTQLFQVVLQDQELRQGYDLFKLFDRIAYLGGAENIEEFRNDVGRGNSQGQLGVPPGGIPAQGVPAGGGGPAPVPGGQPPVPIGTS